MALLPSELKDFEDLLLTQPAVPVKNVIPTIYSFYLPETKQAVDDLWRSTPHLLYDRAYNRNQEALPEMFLNTWRRWSTIELGDEFPYAYATAGASEALRELIRPSIRVNTFEGDYEGFWRLANDRAGLYRIHTREHQMEATYDWNDVFFVTDPSSITGDHRDDLEEWLRQMQERYPWVRIVLDVTYVGAVQRVRTRDLRSHPNVSAVVFSLSKPFGVYYHRIGGVFSREPISTLATNVWFVNTFSLALGTLLMRRYAHDELPRRYSEAQQQVITDAITDGTLPASAVPANVVLFATAPEGDERYCRVNGVYRHCITPGIYREIYGGET